MMYCDQWSHYIGSTPRLWWNDATDSYPFVHYTASFSCCLNHDLPVPCPIWHFLSFLTWLASLTATAILSIWTTTFWKKFWFKSVAAKPSFQFVMLLLSIETITSFCIVRTWESFWYSSLSLCFTSTFSCRWKRTIATKRVVLELLTGFQFS